MNRQNLPVIGMSLLVALLLVAWLMKDRLNGFISQQMPVATRSETRLDSSALTDSLYNYSQNGKAYSYTLLEFGSTGCTICKEMEKELEAMRRCCSDEVQVVFINTMLPENQPLVSHFAIPAIPMQVLLDKKGKEFFRNYGFISARDLQKKLNR